MPLWACAFMRGASILLLICAFQGTAHAQEGWVDDSRPATSALPGGVKSLASVSYGPDARQHFEVYAPVERKADGAPLLVFVHGGAWMLGNSRQALRSQNLLSYWVARRGGVLVSVEYRLVPQVGVAEQVRDVALALVKAQTMAAGWGADAAKTVLMGHSAGAHLAAMLGADPSAALGLGAIRWRGTVALDSAALDLPTLMQQRHARLYDRAFGSDARTWRALSPFHALSSGGTPFLLVCSSRRGEASCGPAQQFADRARSMGVRAEVLSEPLSHMDINGQLGADGPYTRAFAEFLTQIGL